MLVRASKLSRVSIEYQGSAISSIGIIHGKELDVK